MRKWIHSVLSMLALLASYIAIEAALMYRATPPPNMQTFADFLAWRPRSNQFYLHTTPMGRYLEAVGPGHGLLYSCPSSYVFDGTGKLIDRTHDSGDDRTFQQRWRAKGFDALDQSAARAWLAQYAASQPAR